MMNSYFLGFSLWKRRLIKPFFKDKKIIFANLNTLHKFKLSLNDEFFIWGKKIQKSELESKIKQILSAQKQSSNDKIKIYFVEDGFIRSVKLGSDLTQPFSLIVDKLGLYVDPKKPSELENILNKNDFSPQILQRARKLITFLKENKLSKYNSQTHESLKIAQTKQKIILIPAQVEDDASMILGGFGLKTIDFIKKVREKNPKAFIIFKPHPDVLSGNRKGLKEPKIILEYCDLIVNNASIHSCIEICDEVHTITSTAGFDALIRDKKVVVYGLPFYAGWNLTSDMKKCPRRKANLSLEALVAGALIQYPLYINAKNKNLCEIEETLDIMLALQDKYFNNKIYKLKQNSRNFILRKTRRMLEKSLNLWSKP